ncbi:putative uncharacterized protein [Candidatus Colimorpha enterica]|uniref:Uncharacterized protein n=1 Tax=Candidatus Colimorpha enterica TaxID=3083063 RepID=R6TF03_9BACT|nr:putative uncharacterized protein [Candidatus Colimorpha enterica]
MKKTLNNIFDEASANELEKLVSQNAASDVSADTLSSIKNKVYAKTGITQTKTKKSFAFRWQGSSGRNRPAGGGLSMRSIINELWHGNIIPQEDSRTNTKEMKELISYIARHDEDLEKLLTDEQKVIFEKYQDCWNEYVSLAEAAIFEYAFKLGAKLMLAVVSEKEN